MASATGVLVIHRSYLGRTLRWLAALPRGWRSRSQPQLRLRETLALGERRFVAVIEFERQKFLIGGTGSSVAMLTALPPAEMESSQRPKPWPQSGPKPEAGSDGSRVPTWEFTGDGPAVEMVRR